MESTIGITFFSLNYLAEIYLLCFSCHVITFFVCVNFFACFSVLFLLYEHYLKIDFSFKIQVSVYIVFVLQRNK
jgi:hypothetical protein